MLNLKHQHSSQRVHNNSGHLELLDICTVFTCSFKKRMNFQKKKLPGGRVISDSENVVADFFIWEYVWKLGGGDYLQSNNKNSYNFTQISAYLKEEGKFQRFKFQNIIAPKKNHTKYISLHYHSKKLHILHFITLSYNFFCYNIHFITLSVFP